ncbi:hypothetical protein [Halorussus salilacus]|nr:hypothetical protein [Halorussus salilacus]
MTDKPRTPAEKGARMYNKPAWLTKWLIRRRRYEDDEQSDD